MSVESDGLVRFSSQDDRAPVHRTKHSKAAQNAVCNTPKERIVSKCGNVTPNLIEIMKCDSNWMPNAEM
jgi:hypothetical protein